MCPPPICLGEFGIKRLYYVKSRQRDLCRRGLKEAISFAQGPPIGYTKRKQERNKRSI